MAEAASLTVMGGPMAGTRLDIEDAVDEILVGSDPDCRLSLDLPGVSPIHARVWRDLGGITVYDTRSPMGLYVNDDRVVDQAALRDGDVLWLGPPGEPESVMIQCRLPEDGVLGAPVAEAGFAPADEDPVLFASEAAPEPAPEPAFEPAPEPIAVPPPEPMADRMADPMNDPAETVLSFVDPAPAAAAQGDDALILDPPAAPPPVPDDDPFALTDPVPAVEAPSATVTPSPAPMDDDFAGDAAWGEYDPLEAPAQAAAPLDLDALLGEPAAEPVPSEVPAPDAAIPLPAPAAASPAVARQTGGTPPLTRAPRAVIDDTRPEPRKPAAGARPGVPDGVMDWARGAPAAESEVPVAPVRPAARTARTAGRPAGRGPLLPIAGGVLLLAAAAGGYFAWSASRTPRIDSVSPARVTAGGTLAITGANLGDGAGTSTATVGGRPARILQATGDRVQLEVPDVAAAPVGDASLPVVITAAGRESKPAMVAVYAAPRLKAMAPEVGMPGDSVVLSGTALGPGVKVRFADAEAEVLAATPGSVTVRVPALPASVGTELAVVAAAGADRSNALPFVIGKVPLIMTITPRSASAGEAVTVAGRGFNGAPTAIKVTIGGVPALVTAVTPRSIEFIVPRVIAGEGMMSLTVPGSTEVAQAGMSITALPEPIGFRFIAEPFEDVPGHEHAAVSTGLGPAFVVTSGQGKTAAERAVEAAKRLNDAAQVLRSTRTADIRARLDPAPALILATRDTVLLDVAGADAEAYNEDWTRARAKGPAVTPARLAAWWEAVARDLVLLLLRGEKPQYAVALAPEGKVLGDLYDAARRSVAVGVPSALITDKGAMRDGLRAVALRVPAAVTATVADATGTAAAAPADAIAPLKLEGSWTGAEMENGVRTTITVDFRGGSSTLTYERSLRMTVPAIGVQQQKGAVRFEVKVGAGSRFYRGRWDGTRISGKVTSDADGRAEIGTFDLEPAS